MKFQPSIEPYLNGTAFSNALRVPIMNSTGEARSRVNVLEALAAGKKIIHVGFADHIPVIQRKIESKEWLHGRLVDCSSKCLGVDIDENAVHYVMKEFQVRDVYTLNIVNDPVPFFMQEPWDLMILGEVLEHIDDTVEYLRAINKKYGQYVRQLIVTVPNAFSLQNVQSALKGYELINTDHRYWFTPYTLAKVAIRAGFRVDGFTLCHYYEGGKWWKRSLTSRFPLLRDNLVMVLNF